MYRLTFLLFFLLTFLTTTTAQTSGELVARADSLYQAKDYQASGETYDLAFAQHEGAAGALYNAACSWALAGNEDRALDYIEKSIAAGWSNDKWMQKDSDLTLIHDNVLFKKMVEPLTAARLKREENYNLPLKEKLETIRMKDQMLRQLIGNVEEKFGRDSEEMDYFWSLMNQQDSLNEIEVIKIIDEHGWVGTSEVGKTANSGLWLVIQHAPREIQEKYVPLLRESVKKGESKGSHLALTEDRILMRQGKKQLYGSQIKRDQETGKFYLHPVEDPHTLNERRAALGMSPIEDYITRWNIKWDADEMAKQEVE